MEKLTSYVESKGCKLISATPKDKRNIRLSIISSCGHPTEVYYSNFAGKNTGVLCKKCAFDQALVKIKANISCIDCLDVEADGIVMVKEALNDAFDIQITREGALADIVIRPKQCSGDLWYGIQLKTTSCMNNLHQYSFSSRRDHYSNCIVILNVLKERKVWCLPKDYHLPKSRINIGGTAKSKYANFEISLASLCNHIEIILKEYQPRPLREWNVSQNERCNLEDNFVNLRTTKLSFLPYMSPHRNGACYDFIVNGLKVQEKSISIESRKKKTIAFTLKKSNGKQDKVRKYKSYEVGDNDLYWLWLKESNNFYIIPEDVLIQQSVIGPSGKGNLIIPKCGAPLWMGPYTFDINNIDEARIKALFKIN